MKTNPKVDFFFKKAEKWEKEVVAMRKIALECDLTEELKWGCPCYLDEKRNIVVIHHFNDYCAYLFFKGALMKDPKGILIQQTENVQSARQIRFTSVEQIKKLAPTLKKYIEEAIKVEKSGAKVKLKKTSDFPVAEEFQTKLDENHALKEAFEALTPGRQRAYLLYFAAPKQSKTREARIEKCIDLIFDGLGLHDE